MVKLLPVLHGQSLGFHHLRIRHHVTVPEDCLQQHELLISDADLTDFLIGTSPRFSAFVLKRDEERFSLFLFTLLKILRVKSVVLVESGSDVKSMGYIKPKIFILYWGVKSVVLVISRGLNPLYWSAEV
jgi:hypothetical protein